uniref:glucuronosyltransferase n=1 Tax=Meloidogyne incognita TaxID=6306 RepID=A0A914MPP6_MELIC
MISNARIADTLASDGHNVTLLEVEFFEKIGELNASKVANTILVPGQFIDPKEFNTSMIAEMSFKNVYLPMDFLVGSIIQTTFNNACEKFLLVSEKLFDKLRNEKFDIIISEQLNSCGAGVGHLLNIPTNILVSSCPIQEHIASILGLSNPASYIPSLYYSNLPDKMSIYERTTNLFRQFAGYVYLIYGVDPLTKIFKKHYGATFPDLRTIVAESPFVFVNVDEFLDFPRPIFSNIIYIGGLGMEEGKNTKINKNEDPISIEMSTKGKKGVIFFSTGTIMRTTDMGENFRRNVLLTFSQLTDYHFIVKIENDDKISLPQCTLFESVLA